jgi:eukaryotic-like serine/threonine-protein kinase
MTPEHWQRIKAVLDAALEREPNERAAFLDRACRGNESLRRQVDSFLVSYEQSGSFIEEPAFGLMAESLASERTRFAVGSTVGHYKVLAKLGAGGMGEVYLAEDTRLGRKIALKVLPPAFINEDERVQRFQQEARAASALNHPNILTIHEIGQVDSTHFIATEFIEGETLRQHMATAPLKVSEALEIAIQVTSALCAAHEAGIVHRDIKPENIMLRRDGIAKILDFGLAKLTEPKTVSADSPTLFQTIQGRVMGTAYYMSPEQARGLPIDARTDIWSLAVVVYEMIGGQLPFEGPTGNDVIAAILDREPISLLRHSPETPKELDWILKKALRKDRDERYQTARELLTDFKNLKEPWALEVGQKWQRRQVKILAALLAGVALIVAGYFWLRPRQNPNRSQAPANFSFTQLTYQSGTEFFPSLSPDGKTFIYASRESGNWDIYLQRVGGTNPIKLTKDSAADDSQPAFSPDGERIAFRSERDGGGIFLMGATGESITRVSDFGYSPAWSPDGAEIVVGTEKIPQPSTRPTKSQLWTIDIKSNNRRLISEGDALQPTYSPHKYRIAYWGRPSKAGQREDIWTIPVGGGEAVRITDGTTIDINPVWSPDGRYLYFSSNRGGSLNVWRVAIDEKSGATLAQPEAVTTIGAATSALQLSFSRDGRRLAYIAQEDIRNLRKVPFDPETGKIAGEPVWISRGSLQLWFPELSPDGEWVTACSRGQQRHVYIMRPDGSDLRDLTDDNFRNDGWPRWSPDGKRIAFTSRRTGDYELWVINRDGSGLRQLTDSKGAHYSPWSSDGRIAYSDHWPKNECVIIEPDKGGSELKPLYLTSLPNPSMSFEGWSFSPDAKKLAGINHLPNGSHSGIGIYDLASGAYEWLTDFGDWPVWLNDNRRLLFVSQGKIFLYDTQSRQYRPVLTVTDQDVDIGSASLSRDNRMIYFTFVSAEADIWLMNLD